MADETGNFLLDHRRDGTPGGAPVVLVHALGCDLHLWDAVVPLLPHGLDIVRLSLRGHGASPVPPPPYAMGALVRDVERLMDHLALQDAVVVGLSIGGLVAQGLAVKRLDLVRGLVLSNTAAKIGTAAQWQARAALVAEQGIEAVADATLERWFSKAFRDTPVAQVARERLVSTPLPGYLGCMTALAGADFYTTTAGLRLPVLAIAGSDDGSTPADLVRETADLVPGSRFVLLRGAGHLPVLDQPGPWTQAVSGFLHQIGQC